MVGIVKGWGLDPYGTGPYGSSLTGLGIAFHEAHAIATNIVRLTLTGPAMHTSATGGAVRFLSGTDAASSLLAMSLS